MPGLRWCLDSALTVAERLLLLVHTSFFWVLARVSLRVQNAATYVQEARYPVAGVNNGTFDLILIDSTDFGHADSLFTPSFYEDCKALLSPNGILAFNLDSPQWGQIRTAAASEQMARLFKHAYIFQLCAPRPPPPHARRAATHPRAKLPF